MKRRNYKQISETEMSCELFYLNEWHANVFLSGDTYEVHGDGNPLEEGEVLSGELLALNPDGESNYVYSSENEYTYQEVVIVDIWQEAIEAGAIMLSDLDKNKIQKEVDRGILKSALNEKLLDLEYKFSDGRVIQTRPSDQVFISGAISLGGAEWILKDNTTAYVTSSELEVAMKSAAEEISALYLEYSKTLDPKIL
tara:strand:+ start:908 stop:1498 length:591 start_codon:yes stop_codon:yes gene_type:complete